jgi:hypothetical protein
LGDREYRNPVTEETIQTGPAPGRTPPAATGPAPEVGPIAPIEDVDTPLLDTALENPSFSRPSSVLLGESEGLRLQNNGDVRYGTGDAHLGTGFDGALNGEYHGLRGSLDLMGLLTEGDVDIMVGGPMGQMHLAFGGDEDEAALTDAVGLTESESSHASFDLQAGRRHGVTFGFGAEDGAEAERRFFGPRADEVAADVAGLEGDELLAALREQGSDAFREIDGAQDLAARAAELEAGEMLSFEDWERGQVRGGVSAYGATVGASYGRSEANHLAIASFGDGQLQGAFGQADALQVGATANLFGVGFDYAYGEEESVAAQFDVDASTEEGAAALAQLARYQVLPGAESNPELAEEWAQLQAATAALEDRDEEGRLTPEAEAAIAALFGYEDEYRTGHLQADDLPHMAQDLIHHNSRALNLAFEPELGQSYGGVEYTSHVRANADAHRLGFGGFGASLNLFSDEDRVTAVRTLDDNGEEQVTYRIEQADGGAFQTDHTIVGEVGTDGLQIEGTVEDLDLDLPGVERTDSRVADERLASLYDRDQQFLSMDLDAEGLQTLLEVNQDAVLENGGELVLAGLEDSGLAPDAQARVRTLIESGGMDALAEAGPDLSVEERDAVFAAFYGQVTDADVEELEAMGLSPTDALGMVGLLYGDDPQASASRVAAVLVDLEGRSDFSGMAMLLEHIEQNGTPDQQDALLGSTEAGDLWIPERGGQALLGADVDTLVSADPYEAFLAAGHDPDTFAALVTHPDFDLATAVAMAEAGRVDRTELAALLDENGVDVEALDRTRFDPMRIGQSALSTPIFGVDPQRLLETEEFGSDPQIGTMSTNAAYAMLGNARDPRSPDDATLAQEQFDASMGDLLSIGRAVAAGDTEQAGLLVEALRAEGRDPEQMAPFLGAVFSRNPAFGDEDVAMALVDGMVGPNPTEEEIERTIDALYALGEVLPVFEGGAAHVVAAMEDRLYDRMPQS